MAVPRGLRKAREEESTDAEFVIAELLSLATHLDYSDEMGRRKMFDVVRTCKQFNAVLERSQLTVY